MSQDVERYSLPLLAAFWHRFDMKQNSADTRSTFYLPPNTRPLTRSWKSTVAPFSRSFSNISMWPSREARCNAVRRNCPPERLVRPEPVSHQIEAQALPELGALVFCSQPALIQIGLGALPFALPNAARCAFVQLAQLAPLLGTEILPSLAMMLGWR